MTPFFEADLRGEVFQCLIGPSGPIVIGDGGGVCLGVCAIRNLGDLQWRRHGQIEVADEVGQPTWCIVKYEHERCIELPWATTFDEARELGQLLGIVMWRPMLHPSVRAEAFYVTPPSPHFALGWWKNSQVAAQLASTRRVAPARLVRASPRDVKYRGSGVGDKSSDCPWLMK